MKREDVEWREIPSKRHVPVRVGDWDDLAVSQMLVWFMAHGGDRNELVAQAALLREQVREEWQRRWDKWCPACKWGEK